MNRALSGFHIRPPAGDEVSRVGEFFSEQFRGDTPPLMWAAFGRPGDYLLGAVAARPASKSNQRTMFEIFVEKPYRRKHIGITLIRYLYQLAQTNNAAGLQLNSFIHEDEPENAFLRAAGLTIDRKMGTYNYPLNDGWPLTQKIVRRYADTHPHLAGVQIVPLTQVDHRDIAEFITSHYPCGTVNQQMKWLNGYHYDFTLSFAAVRDGRLLGAVMMRSRGDASSVFLDLIVTNPAIRNGPMPVVLLGAMCRVAMAAGYTHIVYEADEQYDSFAVSYARRCGASPQWHRFRYAIDNDAIAQQLTTTTLNKSTPAPAK